MRLTIFTASVLGTLAVPLLAHDPITTKLTWSKEISRLFVKRCMTCHQTGGKAPFPLTRYDEARPWAVAIREEATNRTMPPWGAVRGFGSFEHDPSLTQEEIQTIIDWVNGGAPEGDPQFTTDEKPKDWNPPSAPGKRVPFRTYLALPAGVRLTGLRCSHAPAAGDAQVVLELPDGAVEPLVWIRKYRPEFAHDFVLSESFDIPSGARLKATGAAGATWIAVLQPAQPSKAPGPLPRP